MGVTFALKTDNLKITRKLRLNLPRAARCGWVEYSIGWRENLGASEPSNPVYGVACLGSNTQSLCAHRNHLRLCTACRGRHLLRMTSLLVDCTVQYYEQHRILSINMGLTPLFSLGLSMQQPLVLLAHRNSIKRVMYVRL